MALKAIQSIAKSMLICEYIGEVGPSKGMVSKKDHIIMSEKNELNGGCLAINSTEYTNEARFIRVLP
jgi:hypothetical protein